MVPATQPNRAAVLQRINRWMFAECALAAGLLLYLRRADGATADFADGLLLVMAENSGSLCGTMQDFLDRTFYPAIARGLVMPYALLISAGNDGRGARAQAAEEIELFTAGVAREKLMEG